MKRIISLAMILTLVTMAFCSCKVTSNDSGKKKSEGSGTLFSRYQSDNEVPFMYRFGEASKESFTDAMKELADKNLNDSDFTDNKGVSSALYHCVVSNSGATFIYLEFPDDETADEYWDHWMGLFDDDEALIENKGDYGYVIEIYENGGMYRIGNVCISAAGSDEDLIEEFFAYLGFPSSEEVLYGPVDIKSDWLI